MMYPFSEITTPEPAPLDTYWKYPVDLNSVVIYKSGSTDAGRCRRGVGAYRFIYNRRIVLNRSAERRAVSHSDIRSAEARRAREHDAQCAYQRDHAAGHTLLLPAVLAISVGTGIYGVVSVLRIEL